MKILGIAGSAREGSNTEMLLDTALEEAKEMGVKISKFSLTETSNCPLAQFRGRP
jgi:multimeric flavodoxin WrbA